MCIRDRNATAPIVLRSLSLDRGQSSVLRALSWAVSEGSAVGLVGRNGAGKSSLLHVMLGLLLPTGGECLTLGQDARRIDDDSLSRVGFVDQHYELLDWLTVEEHIQYVALMRRNWDGALEAELRESFDLNEVAGKRVGDLSAGVRQRLAALLALCHRPDLLLLDEPVSAQDPIFRSVVLDAFRRRVITDGTTMVLSSHVLRDIESVVDRIAVLDGGQVTVDESLDTLKENHQQWVVVGGKLTDEEIAGLPYVRRHERSGAALQLYVRAGEAERRELEARHDLMIKVRALPLDRLFPLLVGAGARAAAKEVNA